jgi:hypothetical protein
MIKKICCVVLLFQACFARAQAPEIVWQKCYGGAGHDQGHELLELSDGNFLLLGRTQSVNSGDVTTNHGFYDTWLAKISANGTLLWQQTYGGSSQEIGHSLAQMSDGGFLILSETLSNDQQVTGNHGSFDVWVTKVDASGNLIWSNTLGGSGADFLYTIRPTIDGGFIAAGETASADGDVTSNHGGADCWIVKFDALGNIVWKKTYGGGLADIAASIKQTADGGFIFTGYATSANGDITQSFGNTDVWVVKITGDGELQWQKNYGGSASDIGCDIIITADGGYLVAALSKSSNNDLTFNHGGDDLWLLKIDDSGTIQWQKSYGGVNNEGIFRNSGSKMWQMEDGGYVVGGYAVGAGNSGDVTGGHGLSDQWIIRVDATGNLLWNKCVGGSTVETLNHFYKLADNTFMTIGSSDSSNGDITATHGGDDLWLVKFGTEVLSSPDFDTVMLSVFTNPVTNQLQLPDGLAIDSISITSMSGQKMFQQIGNQRVIDIGHLASGIYILEATSGTKKFQTKFIKQ